MTDHAHKSRPVQQRVTHRVGATQERTARCSGQIGMCKGVLTRMKYVRMYCHIVLSVLGADGVQSACIFVDNESLERGYVLHGCRSCSKRWLGKQWSSEISLLSGQEWSVCRYGVQRLGLQSQTTVHPPPPPSPLALRDLPSYTATVAPTSKIGQKPSFYHPFAPVGTAMKKSKAQYFSITF